MYNKKQTLISQKCPVCKTNLGYRNPSVFFLAKCDDCEAFYTWEAGAEKPKACFIDPNKKAGCGCGGCGR